MSLDKVTFTPLKIIKDYRGSVMHMLRSTDPEFTKFGEVYFSTVNPGQIKAWKMNTKITVHYACIEGKIKLVITDGTDKKVFETGPDNYGLITIPAGLWRGFECISNSKAIICDVMDHPFDPEDMNRKDPHELLDVWPQK